VAFSVESVTADPGDIPLEVMVAAMARRMADILLEQNYEAFMVEDSEETS
jgi:hypothetical protein